MKEYDYKVKHKKLFINFLVIIGILTIAQVVGMILAYKYFSNNLIMTIISIVIINLIGYIVALK